MRRGARCCSCYLVGGLGGAGLTVEPFGRLLMAHERHFASAGSSIKVKRATSRRDVRGDEHQHCTASAEGGHSPISEAHEPVANHVYGRFTCGLWTTPAEVHTPCGSHASATRQGRATPRRVNAPLACQHGARHVNTPRRVDAPGGVSTRARVDTPPGVSTRRGVLTGPRRVKRGDGSS